jgi:hypothetical protein
VKVKASVCKQQNIHMNLTRDQTRSLLNESPRSYFKTEGLSYSCGGPSPISNNLWIEGII